ncbi:MAG: acyl-CoA dehydrogenase family protein [Chloroflexi bacterium]|nr:acyl-CoA dehydrogenase family protein [Chloroflexota bacterium]
MAIATPSSVDEWLDRLRNLAPLVEQYRDEGERERRLPQALFQALRDAGFFSLWVPRNLGGAEVDVETSMRVVEELSRLDGAVGWNVMIAGNTSILWANLAPEVTADMLRERPGHVIAGTVTSGSGTAYPVSGGGFRVTGRWPFASGCQQADWLVSVCHIVDDGQPRRAPDDTPQPYTFVLPATDCEIVDTWDTVGMRGTGSHDFQVDDVFVPAGRYFVARGGRSYQSGPLYNTTFYHLWAPNIAAVALGIARAAIDLFVELAATKKPSRSAVVLAQRETVQEKVGQAEALVRTSRAFLYDTVRQTWPLLVAGQPIPEQLTALNRLAASTAVEYCNAAVDLVFTMSGTTSVYTRGRIERCFRDVHVVRQHAVVSPNGVIQAGRQFLGLGLS